MFAFTYQADFDLNMNGITGFDLGDESIVSANHGRSFAPGELSDRGNIVGWCGYLYEESTGMWLARHRWQIPELGRWANRDPISYAGGGQNLYEYVNGNPVVYVDPMGLWSLRRWIFTGDGNASDEVYESSRNVFANTVSDRVNGIGRFFGFESLSKSLGGTDHIFDEQQAEHAECWAECSALEFANNVFDAVVSPLTGIATFFVDVDINSFDPGSFFDPSGSVGWQPESASDFVEDSFYAVGGTVSWQGFKARWGSNIALVAGRNRLSDSQKKNIQNFREVGYRTQKLGRVISGGGRAFAAADAVYTMVDCRAKCDEEVYGRSAGCRQGEEQKGGTLANGE